MEVVVRPRVLSPHTGETLFLDDALEPLWTEKQVGPVCIQGRAGAGKSTALGWLARRLPAGAMTAILDDPRREQVVEMADTMLVVYGAEEPFHVSHRATFQLASWGEDEVLEYVLASAKERCGSIVDRLRAVPSNERPAWPEMWRACLDVMSEDEAVLTPHEALRRALDRSMTPEVRARAGEASLKDLTKDAGTRGWTGLLRYGAVRRALAAEHLVKLLTSGGPVDLVAAFRDPELVRLAGKACAAHAAAVDRLELLAQGGEGTPLAASLLAAAKPGWRPKAAGGWYLRGACLAGVVWDDLNLHDAHLEDADFGRASLKKATLDAAWMQRANFREADLTGAALGSIVACGADFTCARLDGVSGSRADFMQALLSGATARDAWLQGANFGGARLEGACFAGTDLRKALFQGATAGDVDFTGADLSGADFTEVDLRKARLGGATLIGASLSRTQLEGVTIHEADLTDAWLVQARLTGSALPRACLRRAHLRGAALAEVRWEGADLRDADLRECTFHLGTSRSGLVFGEPMQGSRTGFYDDPARERAWRPAEEVRVADLRGVDLRGALLDRTDFYRVDLRGSKLDPEQQVKVLQDGAFLDD